MFSCNISKHKNPNELLLVKNKIELNEGKKSRFFKSNLESQIRQKPNKKLFGLFQTKLFFYEIGSSGKDGKFKKFLREKLGEEPVFLDSSLIETSVNSMKSFLKTRGYYYPEITSNIKIKRNHAKVFYDISLGNPYRIYGVTLNVADKRINEIISENKDRKYLRAGNDLNRDNMISEQNRISSLLRDNGYYLFNKEFVGFDIDTNEGDYYASIGINVKNKAAFERHDIYYFNNIFAEIELQKPIPENQSILNFGQIYYLPNGFPLNPEVIERAIFLEKNQIFSQTKLDRSFYRLNDLQLFKFINISPIINDSSEKKEINYRIKLTPLPKLDATIEPQAITTDQGNVLSGTTNQNYGLAAVLQLADRNAFHNGEILRLRFRTSFEAQRGVGIPRKPFFNSNEQSLTADIIFPKLVFLKLLENKIENYSAKTLVSNSIIYEQNVDYLRRVFTSGISYQITKKQLSYYIVPFEVSYIRTLFANPDLEEKSKTDPFLQNIFANNLITDSRFGFMFSTQKPEYDKSFFFLKWDLLELAGNTITALNKLFNAEKNSKNVYELLGVNYYQYAKSSIDYRYNQFLDVNNKIVYRLAIGAAFPFGNSPDFVPFEKRYFTGGANSIRAFRPRSIGPGSYNVPDQIDRSGEVKLEANFEYRFNIYNRIIEGALFTDAGNVWTAKNDGRPGANFDSGKFYKQLAVGSGFGLRLNFNIFIFRLDMAVPIYDPRQAEDKRLVIKNLDGMSWIWDNSVFNFGVGYPF